VALSPGLFLAAAGLAKIAFVWIVVLAMLLPVLVWVERRGAGLIQDRPGPNRVGPFGLLQSFADVVKFFMKEDITPTYADRLLYLAAPLVTMIPALTTFAVIPFGSTLPLTIGGELRRIPLVIADVNIGILYVFALTSIGIYGIVLAGWASNDKFSLMGGIRSSAQIISYELAMGLSAIGVFMAASSLRLTTVVESQQGVWLGFIPRWYFIPQALGCVIFIVSAFAETNRLPFDLPEAEAELVAGYHTEYSAFKFAMFFMAEYANLVAASAMIVTLYFGGWSLPGVAFTGVLGALASIAVFALKTGFFIWVFVWVRWTLPRFRYDQLMDLGWKVFLPLSLLNLVWVAVYVTAFSGRG
jgi:NADH-quinone oxidoreductase subunit H